MFKIDQFSGLSECVKCQQNILRLIGELPFESVSPEFMWIRQKSQHK